MTNNENDLFGGSDELLNDDTSLVVDPNKDYWTEYTKEGGKFHDPDETIAKRKVSLAKAESDVFIERLKRENAGIRQELSKHLDEGATRARLEEVLTKLTELGNNKSTSNTGTPPVGNETNNTNTPALSQDDLKKLVNEALQETLSENEKTKNFDSVVEAAKQKFGDNYQQMLRKQANELGLDQKTMNDLARTSPKAFIKTMGLEVDAKDQFQSFAPPKNQVNQQSFKPRSTEKTYSYYEQMRLTEPKKFWSPEIQNERHNQAIKLGENFFDAD